MASVRPESNPMTTRVLLSEKLFSAVERISRVFALIGGVLLFALIIMSLISIIGRKLYSAPVQGDMELIEIGSAIAIAAFLPLAEIRGLNIKADAFTMWVSDGFKRFLDCLSHLLLFAISLLLFWRTWLQMLDYQEYGDSSVLLAIPMWVPLLCILPSLALLALCALTRAFLLFQRGATE